MPSTLTTNRPLRSLLLVLLLIPSGAALAKGGSSDQNIIPNGDFSQGNTGFSSEVPYIKPADNCLWGGYYTVAATFNAIQLHRLIAPEPFPAPIKRTGKEKVFFANLGGTEQRTVWSADVKCQPKTQYLITFNVISLSGHIEDGNPPHQVATMEWVSDFTIGVNDQKSPPFPAGCGVYHKASMVWTSGDSATATVRIVREKMEGHGGGLVGIANVQMVPYKDPAKGASK
jgi:hypothetical protein